MYQRSTLLFSSILIAAATLASQARADSRRDATPPASATSRSIAVTELAYVDTGVGPLKAAPAHGDFARGPHSTFVKLPAGFVSPVHTHTEDYWAVVISGVVANGDPKAKDVALPPGSYWLQKGKAKHVTKCLSANECIVFITQPGKFDYLPAE